MNKRKLEKPTSVSVPAPVKDTHGSDFRPPGWKEIEQSLALESGLSVLLVEGHQPPELTVSNNNSICQAFQSSKDHGHLCDPYCGRAHERAIQEGVVYYRCHAGFACFAMPIGLDKSRSLAVIGGRAFLKTADYRSIVERFRIGDLQSLASSDLFKNVVFSSKDDIEALAVGIEKAVKNYSQTGGEGHKPSRDHSEGGAAPATASDLKRSPGSVRNLPTPSFEPFEKALKSLATTHQISSISLLTCEKGIFTQVFAIGRFASSPARFEFRPKHSNLLTALKKGESVWLSDGPEGLRPVEGSSFKLPEPKHLELFPLLLGDELKGGVLIGDRIPTDDTRLAVTKLCRDLSLPMEVSRLRRKLDQRDQDAMRLQTFAERINSVEPSEPYLSILRCSTELLSAERGSLMLFDEASNELAVKASIGLRADISGKTRIGLEDSVCGTVLRDGRPLMVQDLRAAGQKPAPAERHYKTNSFISYPISVGGRKVGILNVTDKAGGGSYGASDLTLLATMAPQMALALDRAEWREKAAQFQLMSITDPLTGMLNRRYLEERLTEELNRSRRYVYEMSFMMIDIDDFKLYNDRNGHQAGDLALEMTAQCLKSALRSADVASRYGGEEFCILLPQTQLLEAKIIAERIRRRVERTHFPKCEDQPLGAVTVSIGLSTFSSSLQTSETIIRSADRALYAAKHKGKNRVEFIEEDQSQSTLDAPPHSKAEE